MELYKNQILFSKLINKTSEMLNLKKAFIEKDYFVCLLLNLISKKIDGILFKGGTCLSKCFHVVNRFSEDIDLTLDVEHYSQKYKRKANKDLILILDDLNFKLINREQ